MFIMSVSMMTWMGRKSKKEGTCVVYSWFTLLYSRNQHNICKQLWASCHFSCVWLFVTPWTIDLQASLSMEFSKQEYWSRLPFPSPRDLPDPGIEPKSPVSPVLAGGFFTTSTIWEAYRFLIISFLSFGNVLLFLF